VKTHLQRVYEKLGVSDRAAAVAEAMRRGVLD
jgi:two-component system, NarL family, nitrate/nitrite response regulator NarL